MLPGKTVSGYKVLIRMKHNARSCHSYSKKKSKREELEKMHVFINCRQKCLRNMKICQSAWKSHSRLTYREEKYPQAQRRAEGREQRGQTKMSGWFQCYFLIFREADLLHLVWVEHSNFLQTFPISWLSFDIQTYTDTFIWAAGDLHCSIFDNAQETPPSPGLLFNTVFFSKNAF